MSNKSKSKGNRGERRVAQLLMSFTGKNFRRVPASGGFNKQGVVIAEHAFSGDVICDDNSFIFSVESKNRAASWSLAQLLSSTSKAPFTEWWHQTVMDADSIGKLPLLFFKTQNSSTATVGAEHIAVDENGFLRLVGNKPVKYLKFDIYDNIDEIYVRDGNKTVCIGLDKPLPNPYVMNWKDVSSILDPETMFGD